MNVTTSLEKPFWAMHLGMAANNLLAVVQYLERKFANDLPRSDDNTELDETDDTGFADAGIKRIEKSPVIKYLKEAATKADIRLQKKIMDELTKRLPFLREIKKYKETGFTDKKEGKKHEAKQLFPKDIAALFLEYAKLLYNLRNKYTHVVHSGTKQAMPFELYNLLAWNAQTTKERFYKMPNDADSEKIMTPLRKYKGVENKLDENGDCIYEKDNKGNFIVEKNGYRKTVKQPKANPAFLCKLFLHDDSKATDNDFTPVGLAFFAAQFLEPKYISQMIQGLHLPEQHELLVIRAFAITHINLPRTRLATDEELNPLTLGMDILAELHKCPDQLFSMLSREDQNAFRFQSEDGTTENLFKRFKKDRFAYLALNYLGLKKKFDFLRFAIDKGNFFFADYGKTGMIDGVTIEHRRLSKRVYCFKRMQDAQAEYKTDRAKTDTLYWKAQEGASPKGEYRVDMLPQYAVDCNNIGIKLQETKEAKFNQRDDNGRIRFKNPRPDCWLSLYELPVVLFLATQGKAAAVENRIKEYHTAWHTLRADIASGITITETDIAEKYRLNFGDLPDDVKAYVKTGKPKQNKNAAAEMKAALEKMIADTERKLENFRKEQDVVYNQGGFKQGKKSKQPKFKAGSMAAFITKDAVRLQKPQDDSTAHKGKITSANFNAMQASLALFDCRKDSLKNIFEQAGLTRNPTFIENLFVGNLTSLERLFKKYLNGKITFLSEFLNKPEDCYVLRRTVYRNKRKQEVGYITQQAQVWEKMPVNLPRGIFADIVTEILLQEKFAKKYQALPKRNNSGTGVVDKNRPHNTTFLIQKFHEWNGDGDDSQNSDGSQWFYAQPRSAASETLKRLTSFLAPEKQRQPNNIGIPKARQRELHAQWLATPNLGTLYSIEKEYKRLVADDPNYKNRCQKEYEEAMARFESAAAEYENAPEHPREKLEKAKKKADDTYDEMKEAEKLMNEPQPLNERFSRIVHAFDEIEKTLRHIRLQDIALFYAAIEMLGMQNVQGIKLQNIKREAPKQENTKQKTNLLDMTKELKWSYKLPSRPLSPDEEKAKTKIVLDNDLPITITGEFKVKDFGNFRRVINDVRFPSLVRNMLSLGTSPDEIKYATILAEFDDYDEQRRAVFETVHKLELAVTQKYNLEQTEKDGASLIDFLQIVMKLNISDEGKKLLFVYRNAFAHQKYPEFVYFPQKNDTPERIEAGEKLFAAEKEQVAKRRDKQTFTQRIVERLCEVFQNSMNQV